MKYIIIGSGLAGLTTGAFLAQAGHEVQIFEQFHEIGGVTATIHQDGYAWDIGPILLGGFGPKGECTRALRELGLYDQLELIHGDRGLLTPDFAFWPPTAFPTSNHSSIPPPDLYWRKKRLQALFPSETKALDRYYVYLRILKLTHLSNKVKDQKGFKRFVTKTRLLFLVLPINYMMTWNATQFLDHFFAEPKIKGLFAGILADFVIKPSQCPGLGIPIVNEETAFDMRIPLEPERNAYQHAFYYIKDGCEQLVHLLVNFIKNHGGQIHASSRVTRIILSSEDYAQAQAEGIQLTSGETYKADGIISAITAVPTFTQLLPLGILPYKFQQKVQQLNYMQSVFMVHIGIDFDPTPFQPIALAYYYRTYDIKEAVNRVTNGIYHEGKDGFLIYIPSLHSPTMAPSGKHAITIYTVAPNIVKEESKGWTSHREYYADKLIQIAEEYIPGLRDHTQIRLIMTPEDFKTRIAVDHHSFGGTAPVIGAESIPYITPIPNLWYVGCQSESQGGVENQMKGGREVSTIIAQKWKKL
ncbi:MAG: NAD(P)/FAD-dependent oxidoreductase [Promethearchaeota archaeon]|nr:MAG: NAD(P)/FAD-dependent oxidoreductase [Candidatus Lokiarchaeota archaeon]